MFVCLCLYVCVCVGGSRREGRAGRYGMVVWWWMVAADAVPTFVVGGAVSVIYKSMRATHSNVCHLCHLCLRLCVCVCV